MAMYLGNVKIKKGIKFKGRNDSKEQENLER